MRRLCLDCSKLISRGSRCHRCAKARQVQRRGTSAEQAAYRRSVLNATGGRCFACGSTENVEAHHLHPLADRGEKNGPGMPLCRHCHDLLHSKGRPRFGR
jgi:5-methylcytosine-specific restriction endonuclease McrA